MCLSVIFRLKSLMMVIVCHASVGVFKTLLTQEPNASEVVPASPVFSTSQDCERMLWDGFKSPGVKGQPAQGLEGTRGPGQAAAGGHSQDTDGAPKASNGPEALTNPEKMKAKGADIKGPQSPQGQGSDGVAPLAQRRAHGVMLEVGEALDVSQWKKDWSWRDRREFKPAGEQPQGRGWVLARLRVLTIPERGPWLRTLTWQDRITGCVQQVCQQHNTESSVTPGTISGYRLDRKVSIVIICRIRACMQRIDSRSHACPQLCLHPSQGDGRNKGDLLFIAHALIGHVGFLHLYVSNTEPGCRSSLVRRINLSCGWLLLRLMGRTSCSALSMSRMLHWLPYPSASRGRQYRSILRNCCLVSRRRLLVQQVCMPEHGCASHTSIG